MPRLRRKGNAPVQNRIRLSVSHGAAGLSARLSARAAWLRSSGKTPASVRGTAADPNCRICVFCTFPRTARGRAVFSQSLCPCPAKNRKTK